MFSISVGPQKPCFSVQENTHTCHGLFSTCYFHHSQPHLCSFLPRIFSSSHYLRILLCLCAHCCSPFSSIPTVLTTVASLMDSSARSYEMLQCTYGHPLSWSHRRCSVDALVCNNGINSCIMIDVPLVSPGQGLGSFINYLSLVR